MWRGYSLFPSLLKSGVLNEQDLLPERSYLPDTSEVTHLLDNQFEILQHLEGQVEFYKVCLIIIRIHL